MTDEQRPPSMSKAEAARRLQISVRTLERLLENGDLDATRDGPKGGLRPTRASVERRLQQLAGATPAPDVEAAPTEAAPPPKAYRDTAVAIAPSEHASALAPSRDVLPQPRRSNRFACSAKRAGARMGRGGPRMAKRTLRHIWRHPAQTVRAIIAAALITGLLALGATRERPGAEKVTVLVIAAPYGNAKTQRRTRLRCTIQDRPVRVYVGRGWRARCARG